MNCPFCRSSEPVDFSGTQFLRCGYCGLFINKRFPPDAQTLKKWCEKQMLKACHNERKRRDRFEDAKHQLDILERYAEPGLVFDVGAAAGFFMKVAMERGWKAHGNEISVKAIEWAKEQYGIDIEYGFFEDLELEKNAYDAVVMWNILEHTYNPKETLLASRAILKEGGLIYIRIPNKKTTEALNKFYEKLHLYEFTEECLLRHLDSLEFQCIKRETGHNPRSKVPYCDYLYRKEMTR